MKGSNLWFERSLVERPSQEVNATDQGTIHGHAYGIYDKSPMHRAPCGVLGKEID